jgi:murein DD-endopeptidase MepM/ murein hydrolase activator NlpD
MPQRVGRYLLAAVAAGGALRWAGAWGGGPAVAPPIRVTRAYDETTDTLHRDETFAHILTRAGLSPRAQAELLAAATALEPRRMRRGQVVHVRRPVGQPVTEQLMVRTSPERRVWLRHAGGDSGWVQVDERIPWTAAPVVATGTIDRTLYDALDAAVPDTLLPRGERMTLAWAIADVYDWEIDFTRDVRPGDRVQVLFERLESPEGERRFGRILAARVDVAGTPSYAFWFDGEAGRGGFYDDAGRSLRRAFLRAPLEFRRISSRFGSRYHPVLKRWRAHQGTDYAASAGTPVRATADGIVTHAGWEGGYGLLVEIRHPNGVRTRYGHLSRLERGMHVGARVTQRQVVGRVGATGLATGPHLHYEFLVNGRPTNPQRKDAGSGRPVATAQRARFDAARAELLAALEPPVALAATATPGASPRLPRVD